MCVCGLVKDRKSGYFSRFAVIQVKLNRIVKWADCFLEADGLTGDLRPSVSKLLKKTNITNQLKSSIKTFILRLSTALIFCVSTLREKRHVRHLMHLNP